MEKRMGYTGSDLYFIRSLGIKTDNLITVDIKQRDFSPIPLSRTGIHAFANLTKFCYQLKFLYNIARYNEGQNRRFTRDMLGEILENILVSPSHLEDDQRNTLEEEMMSMYSPPAHLADTLVPFSYIEEFIQHIDPSIYKELHETVRAP